MKKPIYLQILLLLSYVSSVHAEIRISEIMTNNVSTIISDKYNYDGFVEFYNDGGSVDLKGWTVTNMKEGQTSWSVKLDSTHVLPNGYSLLFFGKSETGSISASKVQQNYVGRVKQKLSTDEGAIIFEKDGKKIELAYPAQRPHLSYCKDGFMMPTPGKENDQLVTEITNRVAQPTFKSGEPGLYDDKEEVTVELACATEGATIHYTTNGDAPTEKDKVYTEPIKISKTTSLRARAYKAGMLFSEIQTGSYILPEEYYAISKNRGERLPIVSLTINDADVYDSIIGFYVKGINGIDGGCTPVANYNQDWMRSANFEYILNGKVVDNQEVEVGVYGGCTRIHNARSLKIKANKRSGKNKLNYNNFFPERTYKKYKSLALRNGGNGYSYVQPRWRDMFIQSLGKGMNLDYQAAQPVAYYLNGKFYGMMILTERTDEDYVYHNYGLDEDEIDLLHVSGGYVADKGDMVAYDKMIKYVTTNNDKEDFYDVLNTHMDVDNFIDYQILEQYVGNTDWVTNNTKLWRKHDGGRFRWILYDTDFGLSKATKLDTCMLDFTTTLMKNYSMERSIVLMKSCMKNEDFRWKFLDQYLDRIDNQFTDKKIDTNLDSLWSLTDRDMYVTIRNSGFLGCPGDTLEYNNIIEEMRVFAKERKKYVIDQLKKAYGLGNDTVVIKVRAVFPNEETPDFSFLINKREQEGIKYNTWRYNNERVKIEPTIPFGYKIEKWAINNITVRNDNGSRYTKNALTGVADSTELKFTIYFEYDPSHTLPANICLNEVCASNATTLDENGEASDWIEVYNGEDKDIDLAGMTIENETKLVKYTIPSGSSETVIPAKSFKLLWADKNPDLGPLHLNFKLGASATEKIVLRTYYRDGEVELSSLAYTPHNTDESYGRTTDGALTTQVFAKCTDSTGNEITTATPLAENGSIYCQDLTSVEQVTSVPSQKLVYAQGKHICIQQQKDNDVHIYSLKGDLITNKKIDTNECIIKMPTAGIYLVTIGKLCWKVVVE